MSERLNKAQRDALLREQLHTIRSELGEESSDSPINDLEQLLQDSNLPPEPAKQAYEEMRRLRSTPPSSAEYYVIKTYMEWLLALPWHKRTESPINLKLARTILDEEHSSLDEVKRQVLQFLSVAKLKNNIHGPIWCLVGPPGVGKTSLGHSIARALGRKFIRTSLGGIRDEAEIRGHRRTYVGAMPGRIIQSIRRAGTKNPVMILDEIDKIRADFHGDPAAAMLEVLDPEQNKNFTDHYLDIPFDLSDVFFITTANEIDGIPLPLRDRLEIIEINSYTPLEKLEIANQHLVPKLLKEHGLNASQINLPDQSVEKIIHGYTRESGVRELQRKIAALFRGVAAHVVEQQERKVKPSPLTVVELNFEKIKELLGPEKFLSEIADSNRKVGVATGLAWTPYGGEILFIEASAMPAGKGELILTGQLGEVMKESAQIALSLVRSLLLNFYHQTFDPNSQDIHIHAPAGAIHKDGPSAGVPLLVALTSLFLHIPLDPSVSMTGEITLRGAILAVGGIKEKILAAHRVGIKTVILPRRNQKDLTELPEEIRNKLNFVFVDTIQEVLNFLMPSVSSQNSLELSA